MYIYIYNIFRFHGYAYDGIWAIALAIQAVNEEAKLNNQTMLDFKYRSNFCGFSNNEQICILLCKRYNNHNNAINVTFMFNNFMFI